MRRIQSKLTMFLILTAFMSNECMGQYFSRIYHYKEDRGVLLNGTLCNNDFQCVKHEQVICESGYNCQVISRVNPTNGTEIWQRTKPYIADNFYTLQIRNDTVFYSGHSNFISDSIMYWYFGMLSINGDSIAEYKYPILHLKDTDIGDFGYILPYNYGLTLVNNSEVIMWGEGLDNRMPNVNKKIPFRSVFLRVGLDGQQKGDIFWFDKNDIPTRRMHDACTDIDGNMIFAYEWVSVSTEKRAFIRSIFKIQPDNRIDSISSVGIQGYNGLPKIAVDSSGNYFINPVYEGGVAPGTNTFISDVSFVTKINRSGEVLWTSMITPLWRESYFVGIQKQRINRISVARNGDVLCAGTAAILDSFEIEGYDKKMFAANILCSFIARFDPDGNLLWRHFIAPLRKVFDGSIRINTILDIKEAPDGSIFTSGRIERYQDEVTGILDGWFMRLNPEGCLDDSCSHVGKYWMFPGEIVSSSEDDPIATITKLTLYPNPGKGYIHVELPQGMALPVQYQIADMQGQVRESGMQSSEVFTLESGYLTQGMYMISVRDKNGTVSVGKWVKD